MATLRPLQLEKEKKWGQPGTISHQTGTLHYAGGDKVLCPYKKTRTAGQTRRYIGGEEAEKKTAAGLPHSKDVGAGAATRSGRGLGVVVAVVVADPGHAPCEAGFVAAFGGHVEEIVGAEKNVQAACVGGVGVEDFAGGVFVEDA